MAELRQTKNAFKFIGKLTRVDKDGAFKEEQATKGKNQGKTYRSLRIGVKTSANNEMTVQMYSFEPTEVFLWNSEKKKKDANYKGDRVPFDKWFKNQEQYREKGFAVLQNRVGLSYGEDGKIQSKGLPNFVASKEIFDNVSNGDSVVIEGSISYSTYKNQQDKEVLQKSFNIEKIFKLKDVDFDSEKFEEVTYFEQEMVFVDAVNSQEDKKVFVTGRHINYNKTFIDTEFVVDYSDGDAGMKKLADAFVKKMKFGDVLRVFGDAVNRVITEEVESEEEDDDAELLASLGGKTKPKHAQGYTAKTYISEMQIHGVEAWDKKVFTEDDFVVDNLIDEELEGLGGKGKKDTNPFDLGDNDDDMDSDDLPF